MGKQTKETNKRQINLKVDLSKVIPCTEMRGDSLLDTDKLKSMLREAESYLQSFAWCRRITECFYGLGIGGVVAVFLFHIQPDNDSVDEWLWVISGDLPPAYLVVDLSPTPVSALETYITEMDEWVTAVKKGKSTDELIPVNVSPILENAGRLEKRLDFLLKEVIPRYR